MRRTLIALMGITCYTALAAASQQAPELSPDREALRAAVTDTPETINMSYADPKTWHRLPSADGTDLRSPAPPLHPDEDIDQQIAILAASQEF